MLNSSFFNYICDILERTSTSIEIFNLILYEKCHIERRIIIMSYTFFMMFYIFQKFFSRFRFIINNLITLIRVTCGEYIILSQINQIIRTRFLVVPSIFLEISSRSNENFLDLVPRDEDETGWAY